MAVFAIMVKVLYLDHAPYEGGAEVSLKELLKNLPKDKYEVTLMAPSQAIYVQDLAEMGIRVVNFNFHWRTYKFILPLIGDWVGLFRTIRRESPQIVHTNTRVTNILGGLIKIFSSSFPVPYFLINHVRDRDPISGWKFKLIRAADILIANSQMTKDFLIQGGVAEGKIQLIYNGVDLGRFNLEKVKGRMNTLRKELKIKKDELVLTTIGQIYPRKGHQYLMEAFAKIAKKVPNVRLLVVGQDPSPHQEYYHDLVYYNQELGIENQVDFLGYRGDIPEILALSNVFVLPSLEEPFGRVLIEAMAMERSVVATRVGGIPEIIEDGKSGFLVPPKDTEQLAEMIETLLTRGSLRDQFGKRGRKIVKEKFDLIKHVNKIQTLYDELTQELRKSTSSLR